MYWQIIGRFFRGHEGLPQISFKTGNCSELPPRNFDQAHFRIILNLGFCLVGRFFYALGSHGRYHCRKNTLFGGEWCFCLTYFLYFFQTSKQSQKSKHSFPSMFFFGSPPKPFGRIEVQSLCLSTSDFDSNSHGVVEKNGSKREIFYPIWKWVPFFPLRDVYGRKSSVGGFKWRWYDLTVVFFPNSCNHQLENDVGIFLWKSFEYHFCHQSGFRYPIRRWEFFTFRPRIHTA